MPAYIAQPYVAIFSTEVPFSDAFNLCGVDTKLSRTEPHSPVCCRDRLLQACEVKAELPRGLTTAGKAVIWAQKRNDIVMFQLMSAKIGNIYPKTGVR